MDKRSKEQFCFLFFFLLDMDRKFVADKTKCQFGTHERDFRAPFGACRAEMGLSSVAMMDVVMTVSFPRSTTCTSDILHFHFHSIFSVSLIQCFIYYSIL